MEEILTRITEAIAKLSEKHGEAAIQTVLETASLMALHQIILAVVGVIIGAIISWLTMKIKMRQWSDGEIDLFDNPFSVAGKVFGYLIAFVFVASNIATLTNPILWKSVSEPKFYIVYQILKKAK